MIISYNNSYNHVLTISHHNMPCKNKLDVLYFVVASFTWLLRAEQEPFLPTHQKPQLGIVISKNFLHTRKIMVMHSNDREECCLCTIIDHKRKCYDNAVDVVIRLHDRTILVPKVWHLRDLHTFSSVTSLVLLMQLRPRDSFISMTA